MQAKEPPFIKIEDLENLIQLKNLLVEKDKFVLVRSFPGPTGSPINQDFPRHNYLLTNPQYNLEV